MRLARVIDRVRRTLRERAAAALLITSLLAVAIGAALSMLGATGAHRTVIVPTASAVSTEAPGQLYLHVTGAVNQPGLITLTAGARVMDAITAAGGLAADADSAGVNLARPVNDGEQLVVPRLGEQAPGSGTGSSPAGKLINLNTADQTVLESLPHIGPALAARIIAWRQEHGGFRSVDDLRQVSGIGSKTFGDIEPLVTV